MTLARRRLSQRLASRVDPEDIVQSAFRSFFARAREGRFVFAEQDDVCKLLVRITLHKTLRQVAFHKAAKRDPSAETEQGEHHHETLLAVLDGQEVVHIAVAEPDRPLRFHTRVGLRDAAYCTGLGKVLLAHLELAVLEHYLAQVKLGRRTSATITTNGS